MTRTDIINELIRKHGYKTYLEIGVQNGRNFKAVECPNKVGVDPDKNSAATVFLTSDEYFAYCKQNKKKYDIIFIDGLHEYNQVYDDIINALACLNAGGTIVCHDMNPTTEKMQRVPRVQSEWTGDCWKAFVFLRSTSTHLKTCVVDTDYGCGIIQRSDEKTGSIEVNGELNWTHFVQNRRRWLNLISVAEFQQELTGPLPVAQHPVA